jgi:hypothetical protein
MTKDRARRTRELIAEGMATLPRNADGAVDEKLLEEYVAARIDFDADAARRNIARRAIEDRRRPGNTDPEGQLKFDGMDTYEYEPLRLVMGVDRDIIENAQAKPSHKAAEARRTMDNVNKALIQALRRELESSQYGDWALTQVRANRPWSEITFGTFVKEAGVQSD